MRILSQKNYFLQMKMKKRNVYFLRLGFKIYSQIKQNKNFLNIILIIREIRTHE